MASAEEKIELVGSSTVENIMGLINEVPRDKQISAIHSVIEALVIRRQQLAKESADNLELE